MDRDGREKILLSLLFNAFRFLPQEKVKVTLRQHADSIAAVTSRCTCGVIRSLWHPGRPPSAVEFNSQ